MVSFCLLHGFQFSFVATQCKTSQSILQFLSCMREENMDSKLSKECICMKVNAPIKPRIWTLFLFSLPISVTWIIQRKVTRLFLLWFNGNAYTLILISTNSTEPVYQLILLVSILIKLHLWCLINLSYVLHQICQVCSWNFWNASWGEHCQTGFSKLFSCHFMIMNIHGDNPHKMWMKFVN